MKCLYCDHPHTYLLENSQRKCSRCKRKFSPAKQARKAQLLSLFKRGTTATAASRQTHMHIATVLRYYDRFREELVGVCEADYLRHADLVNDYDEYLYLPKSLDAKEEIAKVKHFLTLAYEGKVYTLMMPSINRLGLDPRNNDERKLLEKYLTFKTLSCLSKERGTIRRFWEYFESFICKYKGVSDEKFIYYLKEAEWRFNHGK